MNAVVRPTVPPPARAVLLALVLSLASVAPALAQAPPPIATHVGVRNGERLGTTTAIVGDVDRDGCADYLIGVPGASPNNVTGAGSALLYSGRTGLLLHRIDGTMVGEQRAWVAALGDVNRDSIPDYAVAAPLLPNGFLTAGSIWVISGATNALLYDVRGPADRAKFGLVMTGIGDADGDGADDFAVGCSQIDLINATDIGAVFVLSGVDGSTIRRFDGQFNGQRFGLSVAGVGDLNGDGLADVAIGAPSLENPLRYGSVQLYSPDTGQSLGGIVSNQLQDEMGWLVTGLGDVDGDGTPDWMTSAPWRDENGYADNGAAWVFSGASGAALFQVEGSGDGEHWGSSIAAAGLLNNDVTPDFAVGSPDAHAGVAAAGCVILYSGADGAPLITVGPDPAIPTEGSWVAGGGDVDGDGNDDVMVSASLYGYRTPEGASYSAIGRVDVFGYVASRVLARVDLMPGLCPNVLPSDPNALVTLLVLGDQGLDVSRLVPQSVRLNGIPSVGFASALEDAAGTSTDWSAGVCLCGDTGPDGHPDRAFQFRVGSLAPILSARSPEGIIVNVSGKLTDGQRLLAVACVSTGGRMPFIAPNPVRRGIESALFIEVPQGGAPVRISIHDVRGRLVRKIADVRMDAGSHRLAWDGRRQDGVPAAGGVYFVRTVVGSIERSNRVVLVP